MANFPSHNSKEAASFSALCPPSSSAALEQSRVRLERRPRRQAGDQLAESEARRGGADGVPTCSAALSTSISSADIERTKEKGGTQRCGRGEGPRTRPTPRPESSSAWKWYNGIGSVKLKKIKKLKKLDAQGCTILEKASLCFQPTKNGKPRPCVEEPREFACEEISTGRIYRIEDNLIEISKGNKPAMAIAEHADVLKSAHALFVGDADVDAAKGTIKFNRGRFGKVILKKGK
ncbi:hypothetical protein THAOC_06687, partial [Thalassiosira oceanica]